MLNNILTTAERAALIKKYKEKQLKEPPPNISDETLIIHFGEESHKARLGELQPAPDDIKSMEAQVNTEAAQVSEAAQAPEEAQVNTGGAQKPKKAKGPDPLEEIIIHNIDTKERIVVTRYAYENYISKDHPELQPLPEVPKEVRNKK